MQPKQVHFYKYHALGNDYIVMDPETAGGIRLTEETIRLICHRNFGVGSDGILLGPLPAAQVAKSARKSGRKLTAARGEIGLRIYNPDGSEAEKSGNGLRIFARYLWDRKKVGTEPFAVLTLGGRVTCRILDKGRMVNVEMGRVSFSSKEIPVAGKAREVLNEEITIQGKKLKFCAATVGNPHCVIVGGAKATAENARLLGPDLETERRFPNRTNVQFLEVLDRHNIRIEIWERGAGYTLASGSSSSAAAAVARRLGLVDSPVTVHMPGGKLKIEIDADYAIKMTGPVTAVAQGAMAAELLGR